MNLQRSESYKNEELLSQLFEGSQQFLEDTYAAFSAMGIRRQIKPQEDGSLVGLLTKIIENPSVLSRKRFVELYPADMQSSASRIFDE